MPPAVEARSPNHWTTRDDPLGGFKGDQEMLMAIPQTQLSKAERKLGIRRQTGQCEDACFFMFPGACEPALWPEHTGKLDPEQP